MKPRLLLLPLAVVLCWTASAQTTTIPATSLCNTGLTLASPPPVGCTSSVPVTPINPETGGTSVDGNWELAAPYPSSGVVDEAPNPCKLTAWGPAWVDTPWSGWLNPSDGLSQWITPEAISPTAAPGWYVYRTAVSVPAAAPGYYYYLLKVAGRLLADSYAPTILIGYQNVCVWASGPALQGPSTWTHFAFDALVGPGSQPYLYVLTYNSASATLPNPTGLRVEFTSAYFTPI